ncbi:MAG: valine--tRNA ligase [Rickettsiaceae bacterium]
MIDFPKKYDFNLSQKKWQESWQKGDTYKWNKDEARENTFVVDTPPPTVSGKLHIGHIYSYTNVDFIVRFKRMRGMNIFYPIGFDDNGLPTERLVEKKKKIKASNMDRADFIANCKEIAEDEEAKFQTLFNDIAISFDWSLQYTTISKLSRKISQMSFLDLINKDQIYKSQQPMLWDPVDRTALAQSEIEDKYNVSVMNDIIFTTIKGEQITIATTRPEMLPACVAIFVHPDDTRHSHLIGSYAITPLFALKVPILADSMVKPDKGSGVVMCCTFGDTVDVTWWKTHKLPLRIIIDKSGRIINEFNPDSCIDVDCAKEYFQKIATQKAKDARAIVIELLKSKRLLTKQAEISNVVKCAERSGAPLEILTTNQWFIRSIIHQDALLTRSNELNWYPRSMKIKLDDWINSLAWDWCISRQRYFGVPFPVWYSKRAGEEGKAIFANVNQLPVDPMHDLPDGYSRDEVIADADVMDTWATSAVSPQLNSHAISEEFAVDLDRHRKLFPADLRPQAHEILRSWAFGTILKSHLHSNTLPWKDIMISGWCLAEDKSKMSKSKGNIIDPEKIIAQYSSDVVRYWSSKSKLGSDTVYSQNVIQNGQRLVNKLWNAAKFVGTHFEKLSSDDKNADLYLLNNKICNTLDNWLINKIATIVVKYQEEMECYEYSRAMHLIEDFFWFVFCDNYLEISKTRAYDEAQIYTKGSFSAIITLYYSMEIILKLFAPFMPYITEEIYSILYPNAQSIHARGNWINLNNWPINNRQLQETENAIKILGLIRKFKAHNNLSIKSPIEILEIRDNISLSSDLLLDLKNVASIKRVDFLSQLKEDNNADRLVHDDIYIAIRI